MDVKEWQYMGREKFFELVQELNKVRKSPYYKKVWLYGTQGYGKSHLLAALVCYLAAQDEKVVYIPDCREWLENPVGYIQAALLFAWADDITTQKEIVALRNMDDIMRFVDSQTNVIFVVDQLNALTTNECSPEEAKKRAKLHDWLVLCLSSITSVCSTSANYSEHLKTTVKKSSYIVLHVYGGLTRVSHLQIYVKMRLLT